jgi:hypothetical protein
MIEHRLALHVGVRTTSALEYIPDPLTTAQGRILFALGIPSVIPRAIKATASTASPAARNVIRGCGIRG